MLLFDQAPGASGIVAPSGVKLTFDRGVGMQKELGKLLPVFGGQCEQNSPVKRRGSKHSVAPSSVPMCILKAEPLMISQWILIT